MTIETNQNGTTFEIREEPISLEDAQKCVGGYVQMLTLPNGDQLLFDEEGQIKPNPQINHAAYRHTAIRTKQQPSDLYADGILLVGNVLCLRGSAKWT